MGSLYAMGPPLMHAHLHQCREIDVRKGAMSRLDAATSQSTITTDCDLECPKTTLANPFPEGAVNAINLRLQQMEDSRHALMDQVVALHDELVRNLHETVRAAERLHNATCELLIDFPDLGPYLTEY